MRQNVDRKLKKTVVISLIHQKGGDGKTTNAILISAGLAIRGYKVLVVDSDPMENLWNWALRYEHIMSNKNAGLKEESLIYTDTYNQKPYSFVVELLHKDDKLITVLKKKHDYDVVIIDSSAGIPIRTTIAMDLSDVVLIPVAPRQFGVESAKGIVDLIDIRHENNPGKPKAAFLVNMVVKNLLISKHIDSVLLEYKFPVLKSRNCMRPSVYPKPQTVGQTIFTDDETILSKEQRKDAIAEMDNVIDEIESLYIKGN